MSEIVIKKSKKFQMMEDGLFVDRFLLSFGKEFLKEWDKESQSKDFWRKGAYTNTRNFGRVAISKPLPDKLTVRTGNLIDQLEEGAPGAIRNITLSNGILKIFKGVRASAAAYANRQEKQKAGARSYVGRALTKITNNIELIKKRALKKMAV